MKEDCYGIRKMVEQFQTDITYYSEKLAACGTPYEKKILQKLIQEHAEELIHTIEDCIVKGCQMPSKQEPQPVEEKIFTLQELSNFNGLDGKPAYVAVNGNVYDVSEKNAWTGGNHFGIVAGNDLTSQFMNCHMGMTSVLNQLPQMGILIKKQ